MRVIHSEWRYGVYHYFQGIHMQFNSNNSIAIKKVHKCKVEDEGEKNWHFNLTLKEKKFVFVFVVLLFADEFSHGHCSAYIFKVSFHKFIERNEVVHEHR